MNALEPFSRSWFDWIVAASWQLAVLVCIVALLVTLAHWVRAPAQLRHGLWLLILAKVLLPPSLATPLSLGYWTTGPIVERMNISSWLTAPASGIEEPPVAFAAPVEADASGAASLSWPAILLLAWAAGFVLFWAVVAWRYWRLLQILRSGRVLDEGPIRVALEAIAIDLGLQRIPELIAAPSVSTPFLCGMIRPRIVLPAGMLAQLGENDLRAVLAHELTHWRHCDTWIGWLQVIVQSVFWFHPFLWWANSQLRHERECACDEAVLRLGCVTPEHYGESLVHVLLEARGPSLVAGSLVGVFERGAKLHNRLENIMNHKPVHQDLSWIFRLTLITLAIVLLPMAPRSQSAALAAPGAEPQIIATVPKIGATDVDPALKEISVKFDRDMGQGMSWTGGPPLFPPTPENAKARWTDARTCVLPVKLEKATYYRLGINSSSFRNFKAKDGAPVPSQSIYFVTKGASDEVKNRVAAPQVVKLVPAHSATDVDPSLNAISVTFNIPMGEGMSWTGAPPEFPKIPDGSKGSWSADRCTCTLPVTLEPGRNYMLGLNSSSHINFQSEWGIPLSPQTYIFSTRAAK